MARVESNPVALGTPLPAFRLPDTTGRVRDSAELAGAKAVVVAFLSTRCPFVLHIRERFAAFAAEAAAHGVSTVAINANDGPEEAPARMAAEAATLRYAFPYLKDETQGVARRFDAACTPDFYVYGGDGRLAYHGQFDDSRPGSDRPVTGADLRAAVDAVLAGRAPAAPQRPSLGCNVKWREPTAQPVS